MSRNISSRSNARYRACVQLRTRRGRKRSGQFLIDGPRDCLRAIQSGFTPSEVFCCADYDFAADMRGSDLGAVISWAQSHNVLTLVDPSLFTGLCYGDRNSQVVAVASAVDISLETLAVPSNPLIVVLDGIEKPGNIGAIFRTADAVGADAVLMTGETTDRFNPNAIRSSSGTVFSVPAVKADHALIARWLIEHEIVIALARVDGSCLYWDLPLAKSIAIIFGNEAQGLGPQWQQTSPIEFQIPMAGIADSLNVSVSAAVVLFEARRQRFDG